MNGLGFFRIMSAMLWLVLLVLGALIACSFTISNEVRLEMRYRDHYGAEWKTEFERECGPLSQARFKAWVSVVGMVAIPSAAWLLYRTLKPSRRAQERSSRRKKSLQRQSPAERRARYLRNAVVGVYYGLGGIAAGVALVIFRWGIFLDHATEIWLGVAVFLCGYAAVIAGCSWWLKAKSWNEALVSIGLMPLAIPLIPFVRLLLLTAPMLLPVGMLMTSLILVVVVFVLPDRSRSR